MALSAATVAVLTQLPQTASAAPCCSAPLCQEDPLPQICLSCNPGCSTDDDGTGITDEQAALYGYAHDFDSAAAVCYAAAD
jgi:hypothetical protein